MSGSTIGSARTADRADGAGGAGGAGGGAAALTSGSTIASISIPAAILRLEITSASGPRSAFIFCMASRAVAPTNFFINMAWEIRGYDG